MTLFWEKLNWKYIAISALAAVFISVLSGLVGGVDAASVLLRAVVVLVLFALFASAVNFVAVSFLVSGENPSGGDSETDDSAGGSRVNIVLDEDDNPIPLQPTDDDDKEAEDISGDDGDEESGGRSSQKLGERSKQVDLEMKTSVDIDSLPDLGSFSSTFSTSEPEEEKKTDSGEENEYNKSESFSSGHRLSPEGIAGVIAEQNSPEDLAKAVKTVMNKETK